MKKIIALVVLVVLGGTAAYFGPTALGYLRIGTTFAAQQTCACVHVSGRELPSCVNDLGKAGELLSVKVEGDTVQATALLGLFSGEAKYEPPYGCHPVK
ncbi:MAG: hypothetical protein JNK82_10690 [Myxococcaceae bacterium]|nr:hypothetical protein [Myxococcaceae bacterium]